MPSDVKPLISLGSESLDVADPAERGRALLALGQYGLAIDALQQALAQEPDSAKTLNSLAVAYDKIGRHDLADRFFGEALALDRQSVAVLSNWGYSRLLRGDRAAALELLQEASAIDTGNAVVAGNLALAQGSAVDSEAVAAVSPNDTAPAEPSPVGHVTVMRKVPAVERLAWGVQLLVTLPSAPAEIPAIGVPSETQPEPMYGGTSLAALAAGPVPADAAGIDAIFVAAPQGDAPEDESSLAMQLYAHAAPPSANCVLGVPTANRSGCDFVMLASAELSIIPSAEQIAESTPSLRFHGAFK